ACSIFSRTVVVKLIAASLAGSKKGTGLVSDVVSLHRVDFRKRAPSPFLTDEFPARLETEVAHNRRRHIDEHALPPDLVSADVFADHASNAIQAPALAAVGERRF